MAYGRNVKSSLLTRRPLRFTSFPPHLPVRPYSLPIFDKFSNFFHQNSLFETFCNTSIQSVFWDCFLKIVCLFDKYHKRIYNHFFQTRLDKKATGIFCCCLALSNKIELLQSITKVKFSKENYSPACHEIRYFSFVLI